MIQKHELAKEAKVMSQSADNIGIFYKFVNNRLTCSTGIATLTDNAGNAVTSDTDKAELLISILVLCVLEMMASCLILNK